MKTIAAAVLSLAIAPFARAHAQLPAPPDSELPTGTQVKFWSASQGAKWMDGSLLRFFPVPETRCIGVFSDALSGAVELSHVDSLQILKPGPKGKGPVWVAVSPSAIHARERGCD